MPLRVALAGAGMISWHHLAAWRKLRPRIDLVAVCDPDLGHACNRAEEFGIPKLYGSADAMLAAEAIDAIDIAAPRRTHVAWIEAAAARGINALCQKPLAPALAEAEALARRVGGRNRVMVHENWRFRPWHRELGRWIAAGDLGDVLHCALSDLGSGLLPGASGKRPDLERQPFMAGEARLMIAEALIHQLDVVRFLCGSMRVVGARASRTLAEVKGETLAAIFLETATGAPVLVAGTMAAPGFPARGGDRLEIVGSKASATLADEELRLLGAEPRRIAYDRDAGYQASFDGAIAHFVDCLESGAPFETDIADNLETPRLVEHAYWAAGLHAPEGVRR